MAINMKIFVDISVSIKEVIDNFSQLYCGIVFFRYNVNRLSGPLLFYLTARSTSVTVVHPKF